LGQPGLQSEFQDSQDYTEKSCLEKKEEKGEGEGRRDQREGGGQGRVEREGKEGEEGEGRREERKKNPEEQKIIKT
jgi:hypothetical protein